jgi:hypothetical protein
MEGSNPNMPALLAQGQDGSLYSSLPTQLSGDGGEQSFHGIESTLTVFPQQSIRAHAHNRN